MTIPPKRTNAEWPRRELFRRDGAAAFPLNLTPGALDLRPASHSDPEEGPDAT